LLQQVKGSFAALARFAAGMIVLEFGLTIKAGAFGVGVAEERGILFSISEKRAA
jgi:hypothetical protein